MQGDWLGPRRLRGKFRFEIYQDSGPYRKLEFVVLGDVYLIRVWDLCPGFHLTRSKQSLCCPSLLDA